MSEPNKCKWCGCGIAKITLEVVMEFQCGSIYWINDCEWSPAETCADKLQDRIRQAMEAVKMAKRYYVSDHGFFYQAIIPNEVIQILESEDD